MQSLKLTQQNHSKRQELFYRLLNILGEDSGRLNLDNLIRFLAEMGLMVEIDPRFKTFNNWLEQRNPLEVNLSLEEFCLAFEGNLLQVWRVITSFPT